MTKTEFKKLVDIHTKIKDGSFDLSALTETPQIQTFWNNLYQEAMREELTDEALYIFIMICLDMYTYSETGDVLISDHQYDNLTRLYKKNHKSQPIYFPDHIGTRWVIDSHFAPSLVGSIEKLYTMEELDRWITNTKQTHHSPSIYIAPKYDGLSCVLHIKNHEVVTAMTRGNGVTGQVITPLIQRITRLQPFLNIIRRCVDFSDYYLKIELAMTSSDLAILNSDGITYKNRRSATAGIVNTPKNLEYGHLLTPVPLCIVSEDYTQFEYMAPLATKIEDYTLKHKDPSKSIQNQIESLLLRIRDPQFPYRVDGVVITPIIAQQDFHDDVMQFSVAYKINTQRGMTRVKEIYPSVGRTGFVTPIAKVSPVEVNETVVTDISLSNYAKYKQFKLRYGEMVEVQSAGDVIPMLHPLTPRDAICTGSVIPFPTNCPECGESFTKIREEYYCTNWQCARILSGSIMNFLEKCGIQNVSDKTIDTLYKQNVIHSLEDVLSLQPSDIAKLPGFGEASANIIVSEIQKIRTKPLEISVFFGSLGIENISIKKCRRIFEELTIDQVLTYKPDKLIYELLDIDGFHMKTAKTFAEFINTNKFRIKKLMSYLNIVMDKHYRGNVVFSGFRDEEWKSLFEQSGIMVSDTINQKTLALVYVDPTTSKYAEALRRQITLINYSDIENLYQKLNAS